MKNKLPCGHVAIIGRPNVGKSTLLNHLLGQKISITSRKPQTTRHRILGIKTTDNYQIIYVDTPGLHHHQQGQALNRYLNRAALTAFEGVAAIIWLIEPLRWTTEDDYVLSFLNSQSPPVILGINKIDELSDKTQLLPFLEQTAARFNFQHIIPISALKQDNLAALEQLLLNHLPLQTPLYPEEQLTDRTERFLAAEIIREKLIRRLGDELPYQITVEIEQFIEAPTLTRIAALIWVQKPNQKPIVIGQQGKTLKTIGEAARKDLETLLDKKVFLQLWVKVKQGWSNDEQALRQLGYGE